MKKEKKMKKNVTIDDDVANEKGKGKKNEKRRKGEERGGKKGKEGR